jgi:bifunctional pyridoxal-dependent enzyme with beta-cystathionase and maltose regulon repressor activities
MQIKRDKVWTTLGWSLIGNIAGIGMVRYIEKNNDKYRSLKHFKKREIMKVFSFLGMVGIFTLYGYGNAQQ